MTQEKYIVYNIGTGNVYYKGSTYFGFNPSNEADLEKWKDEMYDDYAAAKRALRKLRKADMKFYTISFPTADKEDWVIAMVKFSVSFNIMFNTIL